MLIELYNIFIHFRKGPPKTESISTGQTSSQKLGKTFQALDSPPPPRYEHLLPFQ
jgi:hypothetical protein